jgi:hypothetical protein
MPAVLFILFLFSCSCPPSGMARPINSTIWDDCRDTILVLVQRALRRW